MGGFGDIGVSNELASPRVKENSSPTKSPRTPRIHAMMDTMENGSSIRNQKTSPKTSSPLTKSASLSSKKSERPPRLRPQFSMSSEFRPKMVDNDNISEKGDGSSRRSLILTRKMNSSLGGVSEVSSEDGRTSSNSGPYLLKQARDLVSSGENPCRALHLALRAAKSFEKSSDGKPDLDLVMSLHIAGAIYCILGRYGEAIPVLERSIEIPSLDHGLTHYLAKFSGYMQLGDTFAMLGQLESSVRCYTKGLELQKQALGDKDPRVGDTCRYLAEAHMQALQFDEAERWCLVALGIHRESCSEGGSVEETADRRLLGLICDTKGDHEKALEHLVLASMAMMSNGQEAEVASVDCSIGDSYLSLAQYDQAVFAYQKALAMFKSTKGENHPSVASVFVRLANLYNKKGKLRESRSYCENAARIYRKQQQPVVLLPAGGTPPPEEIASGLTEMSAIYESMGEPEEALKLLQTALNVYRDAPGRQSTVAAIEAQMGALYYITEDYIESYGSLKNAIEKLRACGEKKAGFFGIVLNQMGLACVQCNAIDEAAEFFEEARNIMEEEYGPYHPDALKVCSNLAGTYDAMGRLNEAIEILEHVVRAREEKLGTANPDVDEEKRRLSVLLKEAGRVRHGKSRSLEALLDTVML